MRVSRRVISNLLVGVAGCAVLAWGFMFAYADWLRFSSPRLPNSLTGQTVREKATSAVFYITPTQAFWVQTMLLPIWLIGATSMGLYALVIRSATPPEVLPARALKIGAVALLASWVALTVFGDHTMALIFTGSLSLPTTPK